MWQIPTALSMEHLDDSAGAVCFSFVVVVETFFPPSHIVVDEEYRGLKVAALLHLVVYLLNFNALTHASLHCVASRTLIPLFDDDTGLLLLAGMVRPSSENKH